MLAGTASAQPPAPKPYPAVFGASTVADSSKATVLNVMIDAAGAYDDNLEADAGGGSGSSLGPYQASGYYSMLTPSLTFERRHNHVIWAGSSYGNVRYYGDLRQVLVTGQSAAFGMSAALTPKTVLTLNQT